jgi:hypothetical protein
MRLRVRFLDRDFRLTPSSGPLPREEGNVLVSFAYVRLLIFLEEIQFRDFFLL